MAYLHFVVYSSFGCLVTLCVALTVVAKRLGVQQQNTGNNPTFVQFQRKYFMAYFLALAADWLQGPYLYKLYSHYGFLESQITVLYVCGFAASVIFGGMTSTLADRFGRKKLCITFCIVYSVSCFMKLSRSYGLLIIGRILGGISTSLLFTAFEAWYAHEHLETHDFPKEWLSVTFSKATLWNGVLAVAAGIIANVFAGFFGFGPVAPFLLSIPLLMVAGALVAMGWQENYSDQRVSCSKTCGEGMRHILSSRRMLLIGAMQSLYESVMYIFIFIWTPVLDPFRLPLGVIFSNFMLCIMIGSAVYQILTAFRQSAAVLVNVAIVIALVSTLICVGSTKPLHEHPTVSYVAFLSLELACGIYFPAMGFLRGKILPESHRAGIMNWFRVPLNLIACIGLMVLHDDPTKAGTRHIFIICSVLLALALCCGLKFRVLTRDSPELIEHDTEIETA
ncbi:molybdate-anion transporter-like [Diadema setosum]|uniref:molybdate-anion transporter-like n=1 Tax=Diadema setosum TaxID=31175 RepID=UPI003B3AC766